ncbi:phosphopantetheine-binding protein [Massilia cavernae]|uniref:Carrier domain-containing protein n=1 Tax=Massilia cavernae TaxID=2320864 RepID=A0A418Y8K5_9BURK|nr:phosphopantetheine-binding protein [Massilia cavernae]RJG27994.1 hypothetical protein D3872_00070 [Massilia cavernae]
MDCVIEKTEARASSAQERTAVLADIWKTILNVDSVGVDVEFFDIGGNSILLLAMLEVVQEKLGKEVALEDLAEGITIEKIDSFLVA